MGERYKQSELLLLTNTDSALLYSGKRHTGFRYPLLNDSPYSQKVFPSRQKKYQINIKNKEIINNNFVNGKQSLQRIRRKLNIILEDNNISQGDLSTNKNIFISNTTRISPLFRISVSKSFTKRKQNLFKVQNQKFQFSKNQKKDQFLAKNIALHKRDNLREWKHNKLFQFDRNLLRREGQSKCFDKALTFRQQNMGRQEDPQQQMMKNSNRFSNIIQGSLQYSVQDMNESILQPWKKGGIKQAQWMQLSQFQN